MAGIDENLGEITKIGTQNGTWYWYQIFHTTSIGPSFLLSALGNGRQPHTIATRQFTDSPKQ